MKKYYLLLIAILFISSVHALSGSIGNARAILRPEVVKGETTIINRTIFVRNINDVPVMVGLQPMEDMQYLAEIEDTEFILQPNESKHAKFKLILSNPGRYEGKIGVSFKPVGNLNESGVGLVSNMIIIATKSNMTNDTKNIGSKTSTSLVVGLGIILGILLLGLLLMFLKQKVKR